MIQVTRRLTLRTKFTTFTINSCNFSSRLFRAPFLSRLIFKPQSSFLHSYSFFPAKSGCHQPQHVHVFEVPFSPHPQTIFLPSMFLHRHSILSANIAGASVCIFFRAVVPKPSCDCFDSCKISFESRRIKIKMSTYSKIFFASVWCHFVLKFCKCSSGSFTIVLQYHHLFWIHSLNTLERRSIFYLTSVLS